MLPKACGEQVKAGEQIDHCRGKGLSLGKNSYWTLQMLAVPLRVYLSEVERVSWAGAECVIRVGTDK